MSTGIFKKFYDSGEWKKVRKSVLERDFYTCQECGRPDCNTVHHIKPITEMNITNPLITLNPNNLETICRDCHDRIHERGQYRKQYERRFVFDEHGNIIKCIEPESREKQRSPF